MSFARLIDVFHQKADNQGNDDYNIKLDFMRRLTNKLGAVVTDPRTDSPITEEYVKSLLQKLPTPMKVGQQSAREMLNNAILELSSNDNEITQLGLEIYLENDGIVINRQNENFDVKFGKWSAKKFFRTHPNEMKKQTYAMRLDGRRLKTKFERRNERADKQREIVHNQRNSVIEMFDKLLNLKSTIEVKKIAVNVTIAIDELCQQQIQLLNIYKDLKSILDDFNEKRSIFAAFLVSC